MPGDGVSAIGKASVEKYDNAKIKSISIDRSTWLLCYNKIMLYNCNNCLPKQFQAIISNNFAHVYHRLSSIPTKIFN